MTVTLRAAVTVSSRAVTTATQTAAAATAAAKAVAMEVARAMPRAAATAMANQQVAVGGRGHTWPGTPPWRTCGLSCSGRIGLGDSRPRHKRHNSLQYK